MDAIAVTLATAGAYLGVAPLGTSLTEDQATQLAGLHKAPIIATDGDIAGRIAAERAYWLLTPHGLDPRHTSFAEGQDPASMLTDDGPTPLRAALHQAGPLAATLIEERLANLPANEQLSGAAHIIAAQPAEHWETSIAALTSRLDASPAAVTTAVADAAADWNHDRGRTSQDHLTETTATRRRLTDAAMAPAERWAPLATALNARLPGQDDWPATAAMFQQLHEAGHDLPELTHALVTEVPLGERPAQDLRYRLAQLLPEPAPVAQATPSSPVRGDGFLRHGTVTRISRPESGPTP